MSVAQLKDRVDLLCQLIELECVSAVNAAPRIQPSPVYGDLLRVSSAAERARESWANTSFPEKPDVGEAPSRREQRARLLEALTDPASMAAYGAPVELGLDTPAGPMHALPAGWACVPPAPGFDREAFRRDTAARALASIVGRAWPGVFPAQLADTAAELADALLARLDPRPEGKE